MRKPAILLLGTGSNTGKSLIAAGLCRAFANRGLTVRPFKSQNMSNNAAVTEDSGEIGRAQALQAMACKTPPSVHMNPVLLKPETETGAQIIKQGQRLTSCKARDYAKLKPTLLPAVLESFSILEGEADLVIAEGAGSPAEVNLRAGDIANLGFAAAAQIPALLIGDIDRGGVIAALAGTHLLLERKEKAIIKGFLINKFRGDPALFDEGMAIIEKNTGWPALGLVPWFDEAANLPAEDSVDLENTSRTSSGAIKIAVLQLPRIANFDDLDPLRTEPDVSLEMIRPGHPLPGDADLVIIPGSKSVIRDLKAVMDNHWDSDIRAHIRRGGHVLGLCGGYQMLGNTISDIHGLEGKPETAAALGLLDIGSTLAPDKTLCHVEGEHIASGTRISGYEIHLGQTEGPDTKRPFLKINGNAQGACTANGRICGTYVHGIFSKDAFRHAYLSSLQTRTHTGTAYAALVEATLENLAAHLETHLDLDRIFAMAQNRSKTASTRTSTR
jgi:adenosylcobyric acid synthase